jgi:nitroimidazol reductase NimA-like FMN-containing flavoprotein (pyridoxamine 5'-phosphate oxidase superfamily)
MEELTEGEIEGLLLGQRVGRIGCSAGGVTYVVPVVYAWERGFVYVYTTEGLKVSMIRENPHVCFEVDVSLPGGGWRSVIIQGHAHELTGDAAAACLALLATRLAPPPGAERRAAPRGNGRPAVALRIEAREVTGRKVDR